MKPHGRRDPRSGFVFLESTGFPSLRTGDAQGLSAGERVQSAGRPGLGVLPVTKRRARPPARTSAWLTVTCVSYSEGGRGCGGFGPADAEPDREPLPGWAGPAGRGRPGRGRPSAGVGGEGGSLNAKRHREGLWGGEEVCMLARARVFRGVYVFRTSSKVGSRVGGAWEAESPRCRVWA